MTETPLVRAFREAATQHFRFLITSYGLTVTHDPFDDWALTLRFTGPAVIVQVDYADDRDHYLNVCVGQSAAGQPTILYSLSEWLDALGVRERRMTHAGSLWEPEQVRRVAHESAAVLADYLPRILSAGADVQATLAHRREEYMRIRNLPLDQQRTR